MHPYSYICYSVNLQIWIRERVPPSPWPPLMLECILIPSDGLAHSGFLFFRSPGL